MMVHSLISYLFTCKQASIINYFYLLLNISFLYNPFDLNYKKVLLTIQALFLSSTSALT